MSSYQKQILQKTSAIYVLIPFLFFAYGWLRFPFSAITLAIVIIVLVALGVGLVKTLRDWADQKPFQMPFWKPFLAAGLVLVLWLSLSGTGGVGFQNDDYPASNALLKDLIEQEWPLRAEIEGESIPIVYYMGYFLPAAGLGKLFGWGVANIFMYFWTLLGIWLTFAWFVRIGRVTLAGRGLKSLLFALFFCLAGGLDVLGYYLLDTHPFRLHSHVEWWTDFFQYSSMTTLLFWVPQHALAAWISTGVLVDAILDPDEIQIPGITLAASIIWSPFGILGTAPYLFAFFLRYLLSPAGRARFFRAGTILFNVAALWIGGVSILYIQANRFSFSIGFIWDVVRYKYRATMGRTILTFDLIEFGLLASLALLLIGVGILFSARANHADASLPFWRRWGQTLARDFKLQPAQLVIFLLALVVLGLLPSFRMGKYNDLVMRGSIPSLFIFFAFVGHVIFETSAKMRRKLSVLYVVMLLVLALSFFPAVAEIARSVKNYHVGAPEYASVQSTATLDELFTITQRLGNEEALFYRWIGK
jgi:hypothetical protein